MLNRRARIYTDRSKEKRANQQREDRERDRMLKGRVIRNVPLRAGRAEPNGAKLTTKVGRDVEPA